MDGPYFVAPVDCALSVLKETKVFRPRDACEALCLLLWWVKEKEIEEQEEEKEKFWKKKK
ncbi:MAG TPA: hypothetical protein VJ327_03100 [Patescibacteria group bacterium]|nr:hypothetical protein [Patescibacteria group bacterium]